MIRISIEGQGATLEEAAADLSKTAVAFIKQAQETKPQREAKPAPAVKPKLELVKDDPPAPEPAKPTAPVQEQPKVDVKMVNAARDQAVAYAERNGGKALQKLLAEFKIKRVSELAKADYPRWLEATAAPVEAEVPDLRDVPEPVEGEDLLK